MLIVEPKANDEMIEGYKDGRDLTTPAPSENRSLSYQHGWAVGRAEKENRRLGTFEEVTRMADAAMAADARR
jgi:hypothetical protein